MLLFPKSRLLATALLASLLLPLAASALQTEYRLDNHPNGEASPPQYGMRLDEIFDVTAGHDLFTFDFAGSDMTLVYDDGDTAGFGDDSIRISGNVMGGLDTGGAYGDPDYFGPWAVSFVYVSNIVSGGNQLEVGSDSPNNQGSITPLFDVGGMMSANGVGIPLVDEQGSSAFSFRFDNTSDHRLAGSGLSGPDTFVGWGWLNHSDEPHVVASDWLFTGSVIPEPGTASLLALGLLGIAVGRRLSPRRKFPIS